MKIHLRDSSPLCLLASAITLAVGTAAIGQTTPDQSLAAAVSQALTAESALKGMDIQSAAHAGTVTLSGHVSSDAARVLASTEAGQVSGVKTVLNNLTVDSTSSPQTKTTTPASTTVALPPRTVIPVRLIDEVSTQAAHAGDTFHATVDRAVYVSGFPLIPAGTPVLGRVLEAKSATKIIGTALLTVELVAIRVPSPSAGPQDLQLTTTQLSTRIPARSSASKSVRLGQQVDLKPQALLSFEIVQPTAIPVEQRDGRYVYRAAATGKAQLPATPTQTQQ